MPISKAMVEHIREGNIVLFLGAGASIGAKHEKNEPIPNGQQLAKMLVNKFLGKEYSGISLLKAAELSISQTDLFAVQGYIASIFINHHPAEFHLLLPTFFWKAIYTTNFDLIIQRVYGQVSIYTPKHPLGVYQPSLALVVGHLPPMVLTSTT